MADILLFVNLLFEKSLCIIYSVSNTVTISFVKSFGKFADFLNGSLIQMDNVKSIVFLIAIYWQLAIYTSNF